MEYLVADVARRHGILRARDVGCVLRADDPALLTEIAATKSLATLKLSILAPTVLASALPLQRTLTALRAAGYAPIGESSDGAPLIERPQQRRAPARARVLTFPTRRPAPDDDYDDDDLDDELGYVTVRQRRTPGSGRHPTARTSADVAATLIRAGDAAESTKPSLFPRVAQAAKANSSPPQRIPGAPVRMPTLRTVQGSATLLHPEEQHVLAQAIDNERPIEILYTDGDDSVTTRVIEPITLDGSMLIAWCRMRDDERAFNLGRISSVRPV
jgi:hypothetical protein